MILDIPMGSEYFRRPIIISIIMKEATELVEIKSIPVPKSYNNGWYGDVAR